jgi:hypothetical protein
MFLKRKIQNQEYIYIYIYIYLTYLFVHERNESMAPRHVLDHLYSQYVLVRRHVDMAEDGAHFVLGRSHLGVKQGLALKNIKKNLGPKSEEASFQGVLAQYG